MKSDFFIDRPVFSTVISIIIVLVGFIGLTLLPVDQYPKIVPPVVSVSASYPGANSQTSVSGGRYTYRAVAQRNSGYALHGVEQLEQRLVLSDIDLRHLDRSGSRCGRGSEQGEIGGVQTSGGSGAEWYFCGEGVLQQAHDHNYNV